MRVRVKMADICHLSRAAIWRILEETKLPGEAHMRSRLRRTGQRSAAYYSLRLLVFLLIVAAKPADSRGSRGDSGDAPSSEWNTEPRSNWWQYACPIDGDFYQTRDMPTDEPVYCQNEKHKVRVVMKQIHKPGRG
jgi:hypothetical protein